MSQEIFVHSRRTAQEKIQKKYPNSKIIDVTSRGEEPFVQLSPFYPHGEIPIPFSEGHFSASVEGIWQGLKVFSSTGIYPAAFENTSMKGLKRTVRKYGTVMGHQKGIASDELLEYLEARKQIFLPVYRWMLVHKASEAVNALNAYYQTSSLVLLDYETNGDPENLSKPLSHAYLVKYYLEGTYPEV